MEDIPPNPVILPPLVVEKPTSIIVFGVLNCVLGGLALVCTPFSLAISLATLHKTMAATNKYIILNAAGGVIGIGFSIWLLITGIGLLMMKRWARKGAVIYAVTNMIWSVITVGLNIAAVALHWLIIPQDGLPSFVGGICGGLCGGFLYPVLLLIFMLTPKVKNAFAVLGR
jgi:hypothetical protein